MEWYWILIIVGLPVLLAICAFLAWQGTSVRVKDCPTALKAHMADVNRNESWNLHT